MERDTNKKTNIWRYYIRHGTEKDSAECIECKKVLQTKEGSTSGLHSHLKTQHNINLLKKVSVSAELRPSASFSEVNHIQSVNVKQSAKPCPSGLITNYFQKTVD